MADTTKDPDVDAFEDGPFLQFGMPEHLVLRAYIERAMEAVDGALREWRREGQLSAENYEFARAKAGRDLLAHYREQLPCLMRDLAIQTGHASLN